MKLEEPKIKKEYFEDLEFFVWPCCKKEALSIIGNKEGFECFDCKKTFLESDFGIIKKKIKIYECECGYKANKYEDKTFRSGLLLCAVCKKYLDERLIMFNDKRIFSLVENNIGHLHDHPRVNLNEGVVIWQPYNAGGKEIALLYEVAKDYGVTVSIRGFNDHYKDCFSIIFILPNANGNLSNVWKLKE